MSVQKLVGTFTHTEQMVLTGMFSSTEEAHKWFYQQQQYIGMDSESVVEVTIRVLRPNIPNLNSR